MASSVSALFSILPTVAPAATGATLAPVKGVEGIAGQSGSPETGQCAGAFSALLHSSQQSTAQGQLSSSLSPGAFQVADVRSGDVLLGQVPTGQALAQAITQTLTGEASIGQALAGQTEGRTSEDGLSTVAGVGQGIKSFKMPDMGADMQPALGMAQEPLIIPVKVEASALGGEAEALPEQDVDVTGTSNAGDLVPTSALAAMIAPAVTQQAPMRGALGREQGSGLAGEVGTAESFDSKVEADIPLAGPQGVRAALRDGQAVASGLEEKSVLGDGFSDGPANDTRMDNTHGRSGAFAAMLDGAQAGDAPSSSSNREGALTSPLLTQTLASPVARPAVLPYSVPPVVQGQSASVSVQAGQFGSDIGVAIARAAEQGSDDLLIRLDPRSMGRIDVRLSFDHDGVLRAVMSAENASALDLLRREGSDLARALADAGVRADQQSLRFDSRSSGQNGQSFFGQGQQNSGQSSNERGQQSRADYMASGSVTNSFGADDAPVYRSLASSGHVDLMA